ncbi:MULTISPECIES: alpha/beta hydrolase [unclassified Coleofasciculus]|uniref:alpha/beta hydrolase n=1 Tax=unclassified Coleofasciculus TaxID=2692782 RepID=UPI00187EBB1F|nr:MULTISPECIES: alpha/beta hydrolase [unclassified Coleofasciculus]MBE9124945.1 alpha/beta hydrolase [Coleofasciculus sp. LEGE 07081]MBE9147969.1 alpha/beta hydrolase [Coleofasciculus sp. LEGE 07092]
MSLEPNPGKTRLTLLGVFLASPFIPLFLSAVGLFLSLSIVVPAPTLAILPLGVGAPEVSPWLVCVNAIALILVILRRHEGWLYNVALVCSLLGLLLSVLPLIHFPAANARIAAEMQTVLGTDYLTKVSQSELLPMRTQPLVLADAFRGISIEEVRIDRGILFAKPDGVKLKLNVYRPLPIGKYPTIIVIYGGAWRTGTPDNNETFNRYMAAQGYSVVAIDYRHAPQYRFPAQLEDVQAALSYIQIHAKELEVDTERMALMGRSAGAHLAMIAAYRLDAVPVRAVVNYYGPVNLTEGYYDPPFPDPIDTRAVLRTFLGGTPDELAEVYRQASPISYVQPELPPTLLVYAGRDHLVQAKFGRQIYEQLQATGNRAVLLEIPWAEHSFDAVFNGVSNQLALYYTERFLAWALKSSYD